MPELWEVFYSFRHENEKEKSRYQILIPYYINSVDGSISLGAAHHLALDPLFIKRVYKIKRFWLGEFLEYQYSEYGGKKIDFLEYTEEIIDKHIKKRNSTDVRDKFIFDWIAKKKMDFSNKERSENVNSNIADENLQEKPYSVKLKEELSMHRFTDYLKSERKLDTNKIDVIYNYIFKNDMPFNIALLNELGYLDYFRKEYCNNESNKRDKLLGNIFKTSSRRIKGNINVLTKRSKESKTDYTSHTYIPKIKEIIKGL